MKKIKKKIDLDREYIIFKRPSCCVRDFLAQDCEGNYHKIQEINPNDILVYEKQKEIELIKKAFKTFVAGEDNSWKSDHNLDILLQTIKDHTWLDSQEDITITCKVCGKPAHLPLGKCLEKFLKNPKKYEKQNEKENN